MTHPTTSLTQIKHSLVENALTAMRDERTPSEEFRRHTRTVTRALAYEASRTLPMQLHRVQTPVAATDGHRLAAEIAAVPVLRAGVGMLDGFLDIMPAATVGYVGMKRNEQTLEPHEYYRNIQLQPHSHLFVLDPMLATGGSIAATLRGIELSELASCSILAIVGAPEGINAITEEFPDVRIYLAAVDERLNDHGYIVPGLGDAGDRLSGTT
jgi:uracil phosphoribosyltransferase